MCGSQRSDRPSRPARDSAFRSRVSATAEAAWLRLLSVWRSHSAAPSSRPVRRPPLLCTELSQSTTLATGRRCSGSWRGWSDASAFIRLGPGIRIPREWTRRCRTISAGCFAQLPECAARRAQRHAASFRSAQRASSAAPEQASDALVVPLMTRTGFAVFRHRLPAGAARLESTRHCRTILCGREGQIVWGGDPNRQRRPTAVWPDVAFKRGSVCVSGGRLRRCTNPLKIPGVAALCCSRAPHGHRLVDVHLQLVSGWIDEGLGRRRPSSRTFALMLYMRGEPSGTSHAARASF